MTGGDAHSSLASLYDVAGQIRAAFIELQAQVRVAMSGQTTGAGDAQGQ
jgi:hypothetical protein